jgi:hypothetical protein
MTITDIRTNDRSRTETAEYLAERICEGMIAHDERDRDRANDAFTEVDRGQFRHLNRVEARKAAVAYVDALWAKDRVERKSMVDGEIDPDLLDAADWEPVRSAFERRQRVVGLDERYADTHTTAWRNHKTGRDYWTPHMQALLYEVRAARQEPNYPHKPGDGHAGFGPEPARYALAVELHDMHSTAHWEQNVRNMRRYFEGILSAHGI